MLKKPFDVAQLLKEVPNTTLYKYPTEEERRYILNAYGFSFDRNIREKLCDEISGVSRSTRWKLENEGRFPARRALGRNSVAWLLSDVLWWVRNPPAVESVNNPYSRKSA